MRTQWLDISVPVKSGMVHWPDNPPVEIKKMLDMERGDKCTVSTLSLGSHTGTHMDAPIHFLKGKKGIDQIPLDVAVGPCRVIEIKDRESIKPQDLKKQKIRNGERILFKTLNSSRCWNTDQFLEDFVYISEESTKMLAEMGIQLVGIDYLSVGGYKADGIAIHTALLSAGIWIIEGLNLSGVKPGPYELICLPLKLMNGDGAPARAILRRK